MPSIKKKSISIVVPLYNEEKAIIRFHKSLIKVLNKIKLDYEVIYVDDGSSDSTVEILQKLNDKAIRLLVLSRNFGKEIALSAGIEHSNSDAIITLDGDSQHPVGLIPKFISKWQNGADVVIGIRKADDSKSTISRLNSALFYRLFNYFSDQELIPGSTDFRLIDRAVANEFNKLREEHRMTRFLIDWLGFDRQFIEFSANERLDGKATYSTKKLIRLAFNSFISSSPKPLYLFAYLGVFISSLSLILGISVIIEQLILGDPLHWKFTGTAMLGILIIFLVGILLMSQGIISLYISSIHNQTKERPLYVINRRKSVGLDRQKIS